MSTAKRALSVLIVSLSLMCLPFAAIAQDDGAVADDALPPGMARYSKSARVDYRSPLRRRDVQAVFESFGVDFPPGATVYYSDTTGRLICVNTPENLKRLDRILAPMCCLVPRNIVVDSTLIRVSPQTAADWGLDGLPPAKPESSPFNGVMPSRLTPELAARFLTALRQTEGFRVVGHCATSSISGTTAASQSVDQQAFPTNVASAATTPPTTDPPADDARPAAGVAVPCFGDPQPLGMQLTATPTLGDDDWTIDVEFRTSFKDLIGWDETPLVTGGAAPQTVHLPIIREYATDTRILMNTGDSMVIAAGQRQAPGIEGLANTTRHTAPTDPGSYFFIITTRRDAVPQKDEVFTILPLDFAP